MPNLNGRFLIRVPVAGPGHTVATCQEWDFDRFNCRIYCAMLGLIGRCFRFRASSTGLAGVRHDATVVCPSRHADEQMQPRLFGPWSADVADGFLILGRMGGRDKEPRMCRLWHGSLLIRAR